MQQLLRFSLSGILGFLITLLMFVGMLSLITQPSRQKTHKDLNISYSYVKDYEPPKEKEPTKREKPELKPAVNPPAAPEITLDQAPDRPADVPSRYDLSDDFSLIDHNITMPGHDHGGGIGHHGNGGLKQGIAPMYPSKLLMQKTEGWVEVLIQVNEFGQVEEVKVLNAKPRRVFNSATIKAVRKWQFYRKVVDGKAMPYQVRQKVNFKIDQ